MKGGIIAMEQWKPISGYEGLYEISDMGRVKSLGNNRFRKEKILSPGKLRNGYLVVQLCKDGKVKRMLVHRLVANAFIPNPLGLETVNHKNELKTDNRVSNLEWLSRGDNCRYGTRDLRIALANEKPVLQLDRLGNVVNRFPSLKEAARQTEISDKNICSACKGRYKSAGGYGWKYATANPFTA